MKSLIAVLILGAAVLTGCGAQGRIINGKWVDNGGGGQVWCIAADDGGIDCDFEHPRK